MKAPFLPILLRSAASACIVAGAALAQQSNEVKVPHPLPTEHPVKGPPPAMPVKERPATTPPRRDATHPQPSAKPKTDLPINPALVHPVRDPNKVYYAAPGDGRVWARGAAYKASFGADGVRFIPFLGSSAPKDYPVSIDLESIDVGGKPLSFTRGVSASRTDETIRFDRGEVIESYEMSPGGMEQRFVFSSLPAGGDLVVSLTVESELCSSETDEGFRFANELGHVSYGRAQVLDAAGKRSPAMTTLNSGMLQIRVPQAFLASATFPITVDPFVSTFVIDITPSFDLAPDVAFIGTADRYLVVEQEQFSTQDDDVYSAFVSASGAVTFNDYVDFTTDSWYSPKVASNNYANNFMVVADVTENPNYFQLIRGATVDAASGAVGPQFDISTGAQGDMSVSSDIGGDPTLAPPTYYLVCWSTRYSATPEDWDIYARLVNAAGQLQGSGPIHVDFSTLDDQSPRVSKSDGHEPFSTQRWTIAWQRVYSTFDHDIWGAQYLWDGSLVNPGFMIDITTFDDYSPKPSSLLDGPGERDYMVAYEQYLPTGGAYYKIHARIMNGTTLLSDADISGLAGQGLQVEPQPSATVDSDGDTYALAYTERFADNNLDYDLYAACVARNGATMQVAERHVNFDFSAAYSRLPEIASTYSGGGAKHRFMLVWDDAEFYANQDDVYGGFYDSGTLASFCSPYPSLFDQVMPCPCGNAPASAGHGCNNSSNTGGAVLASNGTASLSFDTVGFVASGEKPNAVSTLFQGDTPLFSGVPFGQGVRCVGGALKRLYTHSASGGVVYAPVGTDPQVHVRSAQLGDVISAGSARYYFMSYRDPIVLGGCPLASTFNSTQSGSLVWYP
jgi:hypothetical protein